MQRSLVFFKDYFLFDTITVKLNSRTGKSAEWGNNEKFNILYLL